MPILIDENMRSMLGIDSRHDFVAAKGPVISYAYFNLDISRQVRLCENRSDRITDETQFVEEWDNYGQAHEVHPVSVSYMNPIGTPTRQGAQSPPVVPEREPFTDLG